MNGMLSLCRVPPFLHQEVGIAKLVRDPHVGLFDSMGLGKTAQSIIAAQLLFLSGQIDKVIVVAPASVRDVWFNRELGELAKHLFLDVPATVTEYHARSRTWVWGHPTETKRLRWVITNYDFIRNPTRLYDLAVWCDARTFVILDESSAVKSHKAKQTKACGVLRKKCGRIVLLNGNPVAQSPLDMFSQGNLIAPEILECKSYFKFRAHYAVMLPNVAFPKVVGWQNLDELQRRFAPYVLRRVKDECVDLPPKLDPVIRTVPLSPATWRVYREMRDDLIAWIDQQTVSVAPQVVTKIIRLAQITSGFLGGVEDEAGLKLSPSIIGSEKLRDVVEWIPELVEDDPRLKLLVWCRFKPELERLVHTLHHEYPHIRVASITGNQHHTEREAAVALLDPRTAPKDPAIVVASAGHRGLNLTACHTVIYLSHSPSLDERLQSEDRTHRMGQEYAVSYFDYVATGPAGQRTIDDIILTARKKREDVAEWTMSAWRTALTEE